MTRCPAYVNRETESSRNGDTMYCIYKITNPDTGLSYVGYTSNLRKRVEKHRENLTVGCKDFSLQILFEGIPSHAEACEMEKVFIHLHDTFRNGANQNRGGAGPSQHTKETRQKISESSGKLSRKLVAEGRHPFQSGDIQRKTNRRRIEDGTHPFVRPGNLNEQRMKDGTHPFLDKDFQQKVQDFNRERIKKGDHHFCDPDWQRENNRKLIEAGTHNFVGESNPIAKLAKEGRHPRTIKRLKGYWMYIRSLAMCWYEMNDYVMKRRSEFYNRDIPDTSNAKQEKFL